MTDPVLHEMFVLWPACGVDQDRLAALLYAHAVTDSIDDARDLIADVLLMARDGVRPRFGLEMGFTREMFE